jgi:hypothetical protein
MGLCKSRQRGSPCTWRWAGHRRPSDKEVADTRRLDHNEVEYRHVQPRQKWLTIVKYESPNRHNLSITLWVSFWKRESIFNEKRSESPPKKNRSGIEYRSITKSYVRTDVVSPDPWNWNLPRTCLSKYAIRVVVSSCTFVFPTVLFDPWTDASRWLVG